VKLSGIFPPLPGRQALFTSGLVPSLAAATLLLLSPAALPAQDKPLDVQP
jgi:hypothetical protein